MKKLARSKVVVLNGPLGIGKSTLTEALSESIEQCVALDGDCLIAMNPPPLEPTAYLHSTILLLMEQHRRHGYRHFVINHIWRHPLELSDLCRRIRTLDSDSEIRCFLLTLPLEENLQRIRQRRKARVIDDAEFEATTVHEERLALKEAQSGLGDPLDVSPSPAELVATILAQLESQ